MDMLCLRATPLDHSIPSPGELLYNRRLRANLPIRVRNTVPQRDTVQEQLIRRQETQKLYHDQHAQHDLPPLHTGQHVRIQDQTTNLWSPASVQDVCNEPRSYVVATPTGSVLRRNRRHISEAPQQRQSVCDTNHSVQPQSPIKTPSAAVNKPSTTRTETRSGRLIKPVNRLDI